VFVQTNGYQTPSKIIRSIIKLDFNQDAIDVQPQSLAVGIWVVQHEGLTGLGSADIFNDFQQDFYYWTTLFSVQAAVIRMNPSTNVDIRTSRRLRGGYGLLFKAQNETQEEATKLQVSMRNLWVLS